MLRDEPRSANEIGRAASALVNLECKPDASSDAAATDVITLLLVSRHPIVMSGLGALFNSQPFCRVLAETSDGDGGIAAAARLNPQVIVFDLVAQVLNGLSMVREFKQRVPDANIVALSVCTDPSYVSEALRSGLSGYVLKSETFDTLVEAVKRVAAGHRYISRMLDVDAISKEASTCRRVNALGALTARELQVLQLVAEGRTSAQIAEHLGISRRTAETHRANVHSKLMIERRADLVAFALRRGLITRDM